MTERRESYSSTTENNQIKSTDNNLIKHVFFCFSTFNKTCNQWNMFFLFPGSSVCSVSHTYLALRFDGSQPLVACGSKWIYFLKFYWKKKNFPAKSLRKKVKLLLFLPEWDRLEVQRVCTDFYHLDLKNIYHSFSFSLQLFRRVPSSLPKSSNMR